MVNPQTVIDQAKIIAELERLLLEARDRIQALEASAEEPEQKKSK